LAESWEPWRIASFPTPTKGKLRWRGEGESSTSAFSGGEAGREQGSCPHVETLLEEFFPRLDLMLAYSPPTSRASIFLPHPLSAFLPWAEMPDSSAEALILGMTVVRDRVFKVK
jgi:hypothetical protein